MITQRRKENWLPVVVHDNKFIDRYEVSDLGRVRSNIDCRIKGSKAGRVLSQHQDDRGYKQVFLWMNKKQHTLKVARLVMTSFVGERGGLTIDHVDGDKFNNCLQNLEYVTRRENSKRAEKRYFFLGRLMPMADIIRENAPEGVTCGTVYRRVNRLGWFLHDAVLTPLFSTGVGRGQISKK